MMSRWKREFLRKQAKREHKNMQKAAINWLAEKIDKLIKATEIDKDVEHQIRSKRIYGFILI